ncbi:MAG: hypothetical protein AAGA68_13345 [Pseudomonadota bacterium]
MDPRRGADITLNISAVMFDPANNFEEIISAAPGQEVTASPALPPLRTRP